MELSDSLAQTSPFLILISSKKKQSNKRDFECIHPYEQLIEHCWIKKASSITDRVGDMDDIVSKCHPKHAESDNDKDEYQVCNYGVYDSCFIHQRREDHLR